MLGLSSAMTLLVGACQLGAEAVPAAAEPPHAATQRHAGCPPQSAYVTRGDVAVCVDAYTMPGFGREPALMEAVEAEAHCAARAGRLCTEREWETACRGPHGLRYPYGATFQEGRCATGLAVPIEAGLRVACRSGYGVYDMSGNVAEWVQGGLLRGGDVLGEPLEVRCAARSLPHASRAPRFRGARCCFDPSEGTP